MEKTNRNFFFVREEDHTKIVYKIKHTKIMFIFAWLGILGISCWLFGSKNISKYGLYIFIISGILLLIRWICFFKANIEMLDAKKNKRLVIEGNKFSKEPKAIISKTDNINLL